MIVAGLVQAFLGVRAEGQSLESIAQPLTAEEPTPGPAPATPPKSARQVDAKPVVRARDQ